VNLEDQTMLNVQFAKPVHIAIDYTTVLQVQLLCWLSGIAFACFSCYFKFDSLGWLYFYVVCHVFLVSFTSYGLGLGFEFRVSVWLRVSISISVKS